MSFSRISARESHATQVVLEVKMPPAYLAILLGPPHLEGDGRVGWYFADSFFRTVSLRSTLEVAEYGEWLGRTNLERFEIGVAVASRSGLILANAFLTYIVEREEAMTLVLLEATAGTPPKDRN